MDEDEIEKYLSVSDIEQEIEIEKRREETLDRILTALRESGYKFDDET